MAGYTRQSNGWWEEAAGGGGTVRFGITARVLAKCMLKYYRISEWEGVVAGGSWQPF